MEASRFPSAWYSQLKEDLEFCCFIFQVQFVPDFQFSGHLLTFDPKSV